MKIMNRLFMLAALAAGLTQSATLHAAIKPDYVSGLTFGKQDRLPQVSSLAVGKDDFLVVAAANKVFIYDPTKTESVRSFDSGLTNITAVATDGETIYVFTRKTETRDLEYQGRKYKRQVPVGAVCKKFAWDGTPAGDLMLKDLKDVINAKVMNGKIYVADFGGSHSIRVFDAKTGDALAAIGKDLRLCCGILDFAVDPKTGDVLIGNLGAFKLERYRADGQLKSAFGQRGEKLEFFQGCCNPVSVGVLPDENLVVVEKDPSRVKIYTPDGKMLDAFKNLNELTKGCSQVSIAVDSKGRVYLGVNSSQRFVLQYVPKS